MSTPTDGVRVDLTKTSAGTAATRSPGRPLGAILAALVFGLVLLGAWTAIAYATATRTVEERTFAEPVTAVEVVTETGDVHVRAGTPGAAPTLTVTTWGNGEHARWHGEVRDGVLTVTGDCRGFSLVRFCTVDLDLTVPAQVPVQVRTSTGSVDITGTSGPLRAHTATGNVRLQEITGATTARTGTGSITLDEVSGPIVDLHTGTGRIKADALAAPAVTARTGTGNLTLRLQESPTRLQARTDTGAVLVEVPRDGTEYRVDAHTDTGRTTVDVPVRSRSENRLTLQADTGDVTVRTAP